MSCFCAVVVAQNSVVTSVGIDIETTGRIDRQLWGHLFTDEETEHLLQLESAAQSRQATAFFSIKEAFYKYQFPDNARLGRIQRRHRSSRGASFYRLSAQINDATVAHNALAVVEPAGTDQIIALVVDQSVLKPASRRD